MWSDSIRGTVLWWTAYLIIVPIVLAVTAKAKTTILQNRLRRIFFTGELVVVALFLFPFTLDGSTGFGLIADGDLATSIIGLGLFLALLLTMTKKPLRVWVGSIVHIIISVAAFVWLASLQGTNVVNPPLAPIILVLLLLVLNVIALTRLDGLPLPTGHRRTVTIWIVLLLFVMGGMWVSAVVLPNTVPTTSLTVGTLVGSVSYPSEALPEGLVVCAEHAETLATRCTRPYQGRPGGDFTYGSQFTYGNGYNLDILPGEYYVFAQTPLLRETRAYYSALSLCESQAQEPCLDHTPLQVIVQAGKTTNQVSPTDWYAPLTPLSDSARVTDAVLARPEVQEYLANGSARVVQAEAPTTNTEPWSVHVFEILPDHTATFNWYEVDQKTGTVTSAF